MSLSEYSLEKSVMLIMARWVGFWVKEMAYIIEKVLGLFIILVDGEEFEGGFSGGELELVVDLGPFEGLKVELSALDFRH